MRNSATLLAILLTSISSTLLAQIPNAGFETWASGAPDTWFTSNAGNIYITVTQSSTAHGGSSSARGEVISLSGGYVLQPVLQVGAGAAGFAYSGRPASITGWLQYSPVQADRFGVNVFLYKGGKTGTMVANAAIADPTAHASWSQFSVPFNYVSAETPDLCLIQFQIIAPLGGDLPHVGSFFLLDDLALSGTNGVEYTTNAPRSFALHQNYPNPFNPSTMITFDLPAAANVRLVVYNLLGQEVATLVQEHMNAGTHRVSFNGATLPSGTYLVRLQADASVQTRSMVLLK